MAARFVSRACFMGLACGTCEGILSDTDERKCECPCHEPPVRQVCRNTLAEATGSKGAVK